MFTWIWWAVWFNWLVSWLKIISGVTVLATCLGALYIYSFIFPGSHCGWPFLGAGLLTCLFHLFLFSL